VVLKYREIKNGMKDHLEDVISDFKRKLSKFNY